MLCGPHLHARGPHSIQINYVLAGRRFSLRGPQLARGPQFADPWRRLSFFFPINPRLHLFCMVSKKDLQDKIELRWKRYKLNKSMRFLSLNETLYNKCFEVLNIVLCLILRYKGLLIHLIHN